MLAVADSAFDLFILQLRLYAVRCRLLLLVVFLPCYAWSEDDILSHGRSVGTWTGWVTLLVAELRPGATLCYLRIDGFTDNGGADTPSRFHFFAGIVEAVDYAGLGAVFVGCNLGCGQGSGIIYIVAR